MAGLGESLDWWTRRCVKGKPKAGLPGGVNECPCIIQPVVFKGRPLHPGNSHPLVSVIFLHYFIDDFLLIHLLYSLFLKFLLLLLILLLRLTFWAYLLYFSAFLLYFLYHYLFKKPPQLYLLKFQLIFLICAILLWISRSHFCLVLECSLICLF